MIAWLLLFLYAVFAFTILPVIAPVIFGYILYKLDKRKKAVIEFDDGTKIIVDLEKKEVR